MPKGKKKPRNKQLQEENEDLWKSIIELRDGKRCMVKELFPEIAVGHTEVYQADHCFTRGNKHLFLDVANGTMLCSGCNMAKHYDNKSVKRAVDIIVIGREGEEKFQEMMSLDMGMSANHNWNKVWWHEEQQEKLLTILDKMGGGIMNRMTYVEIAKLCHKVNKEYCLALGDDSHKEWDDSPLWQKQSAIRGVELHLVNKDFTPEESHKEWVKQKEQEGWKFGPVKDIEKKEHPCMVPYQELEISQRAKDHIFKAICDFFKMAFCEPSIPGVSDGN